MPQEVSIISPSKNLRGFKSTEDIINDHHLAQRKADEAAWRRNEAAEWLRRMDRGASATLPEHPTEEEFCLSLRNGLILCNVLNKVNPGAVLKVVDNSQLALQSTEAAAQSAIQYFENMRNFLVAVKDMKLLTFEASDLEKGGSSGKVVDCILCLKGYYEWKQAGGIGIWRYGGLVKIVSLPKESPMGSETTDESVDESESSQYEHILDFLHLSNEISNEESEIGNCLAFLFDRFGLRLLQAYLVEANEIEELPLNAMVIDTLLSKVVKDFTTLLVSHGTQLGQFLKRLLKGDISSLSKLEFIEALSQYLKQRTETVSGDFSKFCDCGAKREAINCTINRSSPADEQLINLLKKQLEELKLHHKMTKKEMHQIQSNWEKDLITLWNHIKGLEVASTCYHKVLEENRQLYNQVQDLKGCIRVYCRVRPFLPGQSNGQSTVDYIGENGNVMIVNPLKQGKDARRIFSFNKAYGTNVTQEQIYADTQPLIRSVLDGYNVCIFAYGQTGSGKTYTMSGPDMTTEETWGVNYRALRDLFRISKTRADTVNYEVGVQMIEIYNEQVRDLLVSDGSSRRYIRNNSQLNGLSVPDASWVPVSSTQDVLDLMRIGQRNRAVGATALNERSSRSHSVLTVHVYGKELVSGSILRGCLHLVDLAGSERVDKSEAVGERLREAQHINRSLSALGDVISALAQKSAHVPYRNSKLTQVLQDSLGGHAKTLMFVHISPEVNAIGETISTLKFAERVASIELGAARTNKETGEIRDLKEEISNLKDILEKKEAEIQQLKAGNVRNTTESQKPRAVSPYYLPRYGANSNLKAETPQRLNDEAKNNESRSCSSGKQRRPRFPSALTDREAIPKISRSPSPPVRRSISTDRGAQIRSRIKAETTEHQPITRAPFPARVAVSKSINNSTKVADISSREATKHENISDALLNLQRSTARKIHSEHEDETFRQALTIRHGGIRKMKNESKVKAKSLMPPKFHKSEAEEPPRKSDSTEPESELLHPESLLFSGLKMKKLQKSFAIPRNTQNVESRGNEQPVEMLMAARLENKVPSSMLCNAKEAGNTTSMPEFRRSRSTPRGKFFMLP